MQAPVQEGRELSPLPAGRFSRRAPLPAATAIPRGDSLLDASEPHQAYFFMSSFFMRSFDMSFFAIGADLVEEWSIFLRHFGSRRRLRCTVSSELSQLTRRSPSSCQTCTLTIRCQSDPLYSL